MHTCPSAANTWDFVHAVLVIQTWGYPWVFHFQFLILLIINLMEFLKVWAKHNFYYIRYISVYIQPRYFYLISRSVNGNNMNRVILHSVRPSFWKKRVFSHAPRCGSTESGCEISVPWWLILADRGKMTSVWSRDRDTGDTSEQPGQIKRNQLKRYMPMISYNAYTL